MKQEPRYEIGRDFVLELIVMNMPQENYERSVRYVHALVAFRGSL